MSCSARFSKMRRMLSAIFASERACKSVRIRLVEGLAHLSVVSFKPPFSSKVSAFSCCESVITITEFDFGLIKACSGSPLLLTTFPVPADRADVNRVFVFGVERVFGNHHAAFVH